ncbi:MAG: hypothetical protein ACK5LJ_09400 [Paracoccus sp. (in: a-proteobacteria)]
MEYSNESILNGGDGDDILVLSYSNNNILDGGDGDDQIKLYGSSNQKIIFSGEFGHDVIENKDLETYYSKNHIIILEDLNVDEVSFSLQYSFDLVINSLIDSNNIITIQGQFADYYKMSQLQFKEALLHKSSSKGLFSNIILR